MGTLREPKPAKYFVALLCVDEALFLSVERDLEGLLGAIDTGSEILPWNISRYYEQEMGPGLQRRFVSFASLLSPGQLADTKLQTQRIEENYRWKEGREAGRRVNIDPGYIEAGKVVLASTKNAGHRIYLRAGIYAETTLLYFNGAFQSCVQTYPDYLWPISLAYFATVRSIYLEQLRILQDASGQ